ncbi:MAG: hypothetical protein GY774_29205, partial [Planctomycetes bacterium]|nr:hypothetical protein [Planctomycetota bacterium]
MDKDDGFVPPGNGSVGDNEGASGDAPVDPVSKAEFCRQKMLEFEAFLKQTKAEYELALLQDKSEGTRGDVTATGRPSRDVKSTYMRSGEKTGVEKESEQGGGVEVIQKKKRGRPKLNKNSGDKGENVLLGDPGIEQVTLNLQGKEGKIVLIRDIDGKLSLPNSALDTKLTGTQIPLIVDSTQDFQVGGVAWSSELTKSTQQSVSPASTGSTTPTPPPAQTSFATPVTPVNNVNSIYIMNADGSLSALPANLSSAVAAGGLTNVISANPVLGTTNNGLPNGQQSGVTHNAGANANAQTALQQMLQPPTATATANTTAPPSMVTSQQQHV